MVLLKQKKGDRVTAAKLPTYFHNINNRMGINNQVERGLREAQCHNNTFMNPQSYLNEKMEFRRDPKIPLSMLKKNGNEPEKPKKKKATFESLLCKYGYATEDKSQVERKRPWHYKKPKMEDSSEDENK